LVALRFLDAQEDEAKARDGHQEAEFEILAAVEESVPGPEALGDGHGDGFNGDDKEQ